MSSLGRALADVFRVPGDRRFGNVEQQSAISQIWETNEIIVKTLWPDRWEELLATSTNPKVHRMCNRPLLDGRLRVDAVRNLFDREDHAKEVFAGRVSSRYIICDASPVGEVEIFGAACHMRKPGSEAPIRTVLPAATLGHGFTGVLDKAFALCWMIYLCAGSDPLLVRAWLDSTVALVSDLGVEAGLAEVPDIWPVFEAKLRNEPTPPLEPNSFLFKRAMYVAGWHHILSGVMKTGSHAIPSWPTILAKLRALTTWFRTAGYRETIRLHLETVEPGHPSSHELKKSFSGNFAKWRWETLVIVLSELQRLQFCIPFAREEDFKGKLWSP